MRKLPSDDPHLTCGALVVEVANMTLPTLLPGALQVDFPEYLQSLGR